MSAFSRRIRSWMWGVALASFLAGLGVGLSVPVAYAALKDPDQDNLWLQQFATTYDLSWQQVEKVRLVLQAREQEILEAVSSHREILPPQLLVRLEEARRSADDRIQVVLDSAQLAKYRKHRDQGSTPVGLDLDPSTAR